MLPEWSEDDFYVEVTSTDPILWVYEKRRGQYIAVTPVDWSLKEAIFNELIEQVVYLDHGKTLEDRGVYAPRSAESFALFQKLRPTIRPPMQRPRWFGF